MGNLEKPLTWGLAIIFLAYLFIVNCKCEEENTCLPNSGFNITNSSINSDFKGFYTLKDDDIIEDVGLPLLDEWGRDTVAINKYKETARRLYQAGDSVAPGSPPGVVWVIDRETGEKEGYHQVMIGGVVLFEKAIAPFFIAPNGDTIFPYTHSYINE